MSRSLINFFLDASLLVAFGVQIWSSMIIRFVFPPGPDASGWRLWGLNYDQWLSIQFATVAMLALGVLIHVMLHWSWVCGIVATRICRSKKAKVDDGTQTLYGVGMLIVVLHILGLGLAAAVLMIKGPS